MPQDKGITASNPPQAQAWYGDLAVLPPSARLKSAILLEAREEAGDAHFAARFRAQYADLSAPGLKPNVKNQILDFAKHQVDLKPNVVQLPITKKPTNRLQVLLSLAAGFVVIGAISILLVYMPAEFRGVNDDSEAYPAIKIRGGSSLEPRETKSRASEGAVDPCKLAPEQCIAPVAVPPADQWLESIRQMVAKGHHASAQESFRKFKLSYPHNPATLKDDWK